ncbi:SGNH/GDSL hydrolase family protein [Phytoactinopolyspora endophytica]|uniref:SGNH/GDSL hydrolase family protein n=1 Tax=Phytoactinopolyspora endophytica TaxID=1642495 RepID=UPI00197C9280|nr:SGNH/GDSL hydrolase family protein [Phytoactinopolyspora endophytica]
MRTNKTHDTTPAAAHGNLRYRLGRPTGIASVALAAVALTACGTNEADDTGSEGWTESSQADEAGLSPVLFLGDSVAAGQAVALQQGLAESGVRFIDATSTGGGNIVGPNAEEQWNALPEELGRAGGGVVIYQVTTYDWGTPEEQRAAYERLAETTRELDADLLIASMPPIQPDEFYEPHMDELATAHEAAQQIANNLDGVEYLDAAEVWGNEYAREHDGTIDRSEDGIHTCPQGAARFTSWTLEQLADHYPGFTPAEPDAWANNGWAGSDRFHGC